MNSCRYGAEMFVTVFAVTVIFPATFRTPSEKTTVVKFELVQAISMFSFSVTPTRVLSHVFVAAAGIRSVGTVHVAAAQSQVHALLSVTTPAAVKKKPDTTSVRRIVRRRARPVHRASRPERGLRIAIPFDASHRPNRASPGTRGIRPATASVRSESLGAVSENTRATAIAKMLADPNEDGSGLHGSLARINDAGADRERASERERARHALIARPGRCAAPAMQGARSPGRVSRSRRC